MALSSLLLGVSTAALAGQSLRATSPSFLFMLGDDIGWGDMGYNNGTAHTPRIDAWAKAKGSILMQDAHSGGTVCSPTRATILTGRNHFRDCVKYVYGCSDMTECVPNFAFAPTRTFTLGDAFQAAYAATNADASSLFIGKWHLGSFYNDSEAYGGITSSPTTHGFDHFNATVEVAPTATTNCQCRTEWTDHCNFGHNKPSEHCQGGANPSPGGRKGCCFNYWWNDGTRDHGVANLTHPTPDDDTRYMSSAFEEFVARRNGAPFLAQISFHNCHIPFVGTEGARAACAAGETCRTPDPGAPAYTSMELDYYSCLSELDGGVGRVLDTLHYHGYYDNTFVWMTMDNGPEQNCPPVGICGGTPQRVREGPGSSGPLRGRKRDVWEGGHRVPTIVSWPAVVGDTNRVSWDTVVTMDFLPTVMEALGVARPAEQAAWALDGRSILPIMRGEPWPLRGIGWSFNTLDGATGEAFRYGPWKYVRASKSCTHPACKQPLLYNLDNDLGERHDVGAAHPDILAAMQQNMTAWRASVQASIDTEARCPN